MWVSKRQNFTLFKVSCKPTKPSSIALLNIIVPKGCWILSVPTVSTKGISLLLTIVQLTFSAQNKEVTRGTWKGGVEQFIPVGGNSILSREFLMPLRKLDMSSAWRFLRRNHCELVNPSLVVGAFQVSIHASMAFLNTDHDFPFYMKVHACVYHCKMVHICTIVLDLCALLTDRKSVV